MGGRQTAVRPSYFADDQPFFQAVAHFFTMPANPPSRLGVFVTGLFAAHFSDQASRQADDSSLSPVKGRFSEFSDQHFFSRFNGTTSSVSLPKQTFRSRDVSFVMSTTQEVFGLPCRRFESSGNPGQKDVIAPVFSLPLPSLPHNRT